MKMYEGVDVQIHIFLTLILVGGEWLVSRPGQFTPGKKSPRYPLDRRLGGSLNEYGQLGEEKNLAPTGTRTPTPWPSSLEPVDILTAISLVPM
jgi:hypothetical protein